MNWKGLVLGIAAIALLGFGGLVYRNALERSNRPIACPLDAKVCPDGTAVAREGLSCTFPACPPPNVSLPDLGISFAIPLEAVSAPLPDAAAVAAYALFGSATSSEAGIITIRRYPIAATSTALSTIQKTAIGGATGEPVPLTSYSSKTYGTRRYTVVGLGRFEGVVNTAYYLARERDVLRFDAVDQTAEWRNKNLDPATLPAHAALISLLATVQGQ